ncbi:hypothetical protein OXYTRIMIC_426 [Oxytricha trifallax]|uniref:Uncharacterized protein n=1 Tax=Oxytricha trifallax TaxID=1172189 RepID=A0A073HYS2_9SPIT|nr:hypothetical protein OXYTRIMIC_426 [Oxytricha trifallax]
MIKKALIEVKKVEVMFGANDLDGENIFFRSRQQEERQKDFKKFISSHKQLQEALKIVKSEKLLNQKTHVINQVSNQIKKVIQELLNGRNETLMKWKEFNPEK